MLSICPAWLADRRDDLVQTVLIALMKHHPEHKGGFTSSYLKKAAYHALVDEIRRQRRQREVSVEVEVDDAAAPRSSAPDPEQRYAGREIGRAIQQCLARLSAARRDAVLLVLLGHSMPEAAKWLGGTTKRIQNLVLRGRADLRKCLLAKGIEP